MLVAPQVGFNNWNNCKTYGNVFHTPLISSNGHVMYFHDAIHSKVTEKQEAQISPVLLLLYKVRMPKAMYVHKYWHLQTVLASQPQSLLEYFADQMSFSTS